MRNTESDGHLTPAEGLRAVEAFWQSKLPDTFKNLYLHYEQPFIAPCEFFSLEAITRGAGRSYGMLPQFMPFGRAVGEGGVYGFYVTPDTALGYWPVLYWDDDEMFLKPTSSCFESFLKQCILVGRYETEEQLNASEAIADELDEQREIGQKLLLDAEISFGRLPRNDTELHERLAQLDPMDATSLCHLGCVSRSRNDVERALDFFHRAIEAAPWFGDAYYLLADTYRELNKKPRAVQGWWGVAQCHLPLCTRTWQWDLGEDHPEADIYEIAADALRQYSKDVSDEIKATSLWKVVVGDDPYDPDVRQAFANSLRVSGDIQGAEREYLNTLSLCCSEKGKQPNRVYALLVDLYEEQGRTRDASLARFDSRLARPGTD